MKETINLDQFVIVLHFFFERSATRRDDFNQMSSITDVAVKYLLRHCESCWLSIEKVLVRIIEQYENLKSYFLSELPKTTTFKGYQGVGNTARYKRISSCLNDNALLPYMSFVVSVTQDFRKFLVLLQTSSPMIHILHSMEIKLIHSLLSKFVDSKYISNKETNKT